MGTTTSIKSIKLTLKSMLKPPEVISVIHIRDLFGGGIWKPSLVILKNDSFIFLVWVRVCIMGFLRISLKLGAEFRFLMTYSQRTFPNQ